ncbi:mitochondrial import inner membrane translocase subunit TIM14 isoform X1 [Anolis carolinensis]|uniref:mitochondrial import inner membrane translocase subunit TIM14 isoform X1 n=1 Tax=Anolis carolinensis TaxID=28377 RepID=UPI002F2B4DDE
MPFPINPEAISAKGKKGKIFSEEKGEGGVASFYDAREAWARFTAGLLRRRKTGLGLALRRRRRRRRARFTDAFRGQPRVWEEGKERGGFAIPTGSFLSATGLWSHGKYYDSGGSDNSCCWICRPSVVITEEDSKPK